MIRAPRFDARQLRVCALPIMNLVSKRRFVQLSTTHRGRCVARRPISSHVMTGACAVCPEPPQANSALEPTGFARKMVV